MIDQDDLPSDPAIRALAEARQARSYPLCPQCAKPLSEFGKGWICDDPKCKQFDEVVEAISEAIGDLAGDTPRSASGSLGGHDASEAEQCERALSVWIHEYTQSGKGGAGSEVAIVAFRSGWLACSGEK